MTFRRIGAFLLSAICLFGQQEPLVFRSGTQLVQVSVVVHDKKGEPVPDLKKEDFTILEKGKPQQVAFFSVESAADEPKLASPLPPNIFSNRITQRDRVPTSVTAIVLDAINTAGMDQMYARQHVVEFLKQLKPSDRVALYSLGTSLRVLHDYTSDASSLLALISKYGAQALPNLANSSTKLDDSLAEMLREQPELLRMMQEMVDRQAAFATDDRIRNTLAGLQSIALHLSSLPGRKNLIWVSGGFPIVFGMDERTTGGELRVSKELRSYGTEVEQAVRTINQANVAIYPVDARGLMGLGGIFDAAVRSQPVGPGVVPETPYNRNIDSMQTLAERTGGRAAYNTNDLKRAIRDAVDDARVTYTLSFYPAQEADGKWHELQVKVNRPGLEIRHRKGYLANIMKPRTDAERSADLRAAVWSPLDSTSIAVNARVDRYPSPENTINMMLQVDVSSLGMVQKDDRWTNEVHIIFAQKDVTGKVVDAPSVNLDLNLKKESYAKALVQGMFFERALKRAPDAVSLRVVVWDRNRGSIGSVTIPVKDPTIFPEVKAKK